MTNTIGPLCALGSSITWAIGSSYYAQLAARYSSFSINFARALVSLPFFLALSVWSAGGLDAGFARFQAIESYQLGWVLLSIFSSYGFGDALFFLSTRSLGVPSALAIASCFPVWTVLAGVVFGGEVLAWHQGIGLALTVFGLVVVILTGARTEKSAQKGKPLDFIFAGLTSLLWASNTFAVSRGGAELAPEVGNVLRMSIALFVSACFGKVFFRKDPVLIPRHQLVPLLWVFIGEAFLGSYLGFYGLSHSPLALGASLSSLSPVVSIPIALTLGVEKLSIQKVTGVVLVVLGICFLLGVFVV